MRKQCIGAIAIIIALFAVALGVQIAELVQHIPFSTELQMARQVPAGVVGVSVFLFLAKRKRLAKQCEPLVMRLADVDDAEAVGPMLDCLAMSDDALPAITILTRILPRLQPGDADLLNNSQRATLYRHIEPFSLTDSNVDFAHVALEAIEIVGDAKAIPCLERLIASKRDDVVTERLKTTARECLEVVRARLKEDAGRTLLRPSQGASSDGLLRPVSAREETPVDQLVRPSSGKLPEAQQASETKTATTPPEEEPAVLRQKR